MVDLLLLFGGYATVFLVSPKRKAGSAVPRSLARDAGQSGAQVLHDISVCKDTLEPSTKDRSLQPCINLFADDRTVVSVGQMASYKSTSLEPSVEVI